MTTIGLADTNDPAMFVGAEEGKVTVAVPLDDNVAPGPLWAPRGAPGPAPALHLRSFRAVSPFGAALLAPPAP